VSQRGAAGLSEAPRTVEGMDNWQPLPLWEDDPEPAEAEVSAAAAAPVATATWADAVGVFDLETTGVDVERDRVVTAHVGLLGPGGAVLQSRGWLADPGVEIPEGATAVHGITTAHAREHGRPAAHVVGEVVAALQELFEALRHGIPPITDPSPVIDPLVLDKAHDRFRKGKRTLEVVAAHYAVTLEGAHDAMADAVAAGRVAQALARRYELNGPVAELHAQQIGWARTQADSLTDYFIRIGRLDPEDRIDGSWPIR